LHIYDDRFFDWVDSGARRSARALLPHVQRAVRLESVLDVGCGRGTWLAVWQEIGIEDVVGIDGDYVRRDKLAIPADRFVVTDLRAARVDRKFDLVQSLEVGEHIAPSCSDAFVALLCAAGDVVFFSAAQPGQGGEMHVNEQTPEFWAGLFARHGFERYDCIRHYVASDRRIEPWYRYNSFIFANEIGRTRLSPEAAAAHLPASLTAPDFGGFVWWVRRLVLRRMPTTAVTLLSRLNYRVVTVLRAFQVIG
jgi:SAM-dependent methyltransferase